MSLKQLRTGSKTVTTAGTRVALSATKLLVRGLKIKGKTGNTGLVYIGDVTVTAATGYDLAAGVELDTKTVLNDDSIIDLSKVYADAATSGDKVTFVYFDDNQAL